MSDPISGPEPSDDRDRSDALADAAHNDDDRKGVSASEQRAADTAYSPSSERESVASQDEQRDDDDLRADGIDPSKVTAAPGTGGADDAGDVEPAPEDLHLPWQSEDDRRG